MDTDRDIQTKILEQHERQTEALERIAELLGQWAQPKAVVDGEIRITNWKQGVGYLKSYPDPSGRMHKRLLSRMQ